MFDVLVYLYENYWRPDACPDHEQLTRKLSSVGFESDEIQEALVWLDGLAGAAQAYVGEQGGSSLRVYQPGEQDHLGVDSIGFISFLESAGVLPPPMREMVIDRAMAAGGNPQQAVSQYQRELDKAMKAAAQHTADQAASVADEGAR